MKRTLYLLAGLCLVLVATSTVLGITTVQLEQRISELEKTDAVPGPRGPEGPAGAAGPMGPMGPPGLDGDRCPFGSPETITVLTDVEPVYLTFVKETARVEVCTW
jgi:hypothetical protein